jgi:WD repeat-containing protein 81
MKCRLILQTVNDVCILPGSGRLASCDGTIHIWNAHTGQRLAHFDESTSFPLTSSSATPSAGVSADSGKPAADVQNINGASTSTYGLTARLTGSGLYSRLHSMEAEERLLGGLVNGTLR